MSPSTDAAAPLGGLFEPLPRILFHDDFNRGPSGWGALIGNYEDRIDTMLPEYRDMRGPMLSNLSMWDAGTSGAIGGSYALKLATRPKPGAFSVAIKRFTFRHWCTVRVEAIVTFKPEASALELGETAVRAVGMVLDLQHADRQSSTPLRVMPHVRYLNAFAGERVERWQYKKPARAAARHRAPWQDLVPLPSGVAPVGGHPRRRPAAVLQRDRHQAQLVLSASRLRSAGDAVSRTPMQRTRVRPQRRCADEPAGDAHLWSMLNIVFWVESDAPRRAFLYLDSVVVSTEEG